MRARITGCVHTQLDEVNQLLKAAIAKSLNNTKGTGKSPDEEEATAEIEESPEVPEDERPDATVEVEKDTVEKPASTTDTSTPITESPPVESLPPIEIVESDSGDVTVEVEMTHLI